MASILDTIGKGRADQEQEQRDLARRQLYRRAFSTEAGRQVLADMAHSVGVHMASVPYDADRRLDTNEMARREGARAFVLEVMAQAGVALEFTFPPLETEAKRPTEIETEKAA